MMFGTNKTSFATAERIPKNTIGVELGVWKGDTSMLFLQNAKHLHMVDSWSPTAYEQAMDEAGFKNYLKRYGTIVKNNTVGGYKQYYEQIWAHVNKKFQGKPVALHRMTTDDFFRRFKEKVDWVFVDALHTYDNCLKDLKNSLNIVKKGGSIYGDDYGVKPGTTKAVDEFIAGTGYTLDNFYKDQFEIKI